MELLQQGRMDEAVVLANSIIHKATLPQPWFNKDCYRERKDTLLALHKARTDGSEEDLKHYAEKRRTYRLLLKQRKTEFLEEEAKKTAEEAKHNPFVALKTRRLVHKQDRFP